jgi:hypothetical protein
MTGGDRRAGVALERACGWLHASAFETGYRRLCRFHPRRDLLLRRAGTSACTQQSLCQGEPVQQRLVLAPIRPDFSSTAWQIIRSTPINAAAMALLVARE